MNKIWGHLTKLNLELFVLFVVMEFDIIVSVLDFALVAVSLFNIH